MTPAAEVYDITLLHVEDEDTTRAQMAMLLQDRVRTFLSASDGKQGLQLYLDHSPDIILTDIIMPDMDGLAMARKIREHSLDAQIIALTAMNDTESMLNAIDVGINKFVLKPVSMKNVFAAMESCMEVVRLRRSLKAQQERIETLSTALEQSPSIVVITDTGGTIEQVNQKFCDVTGYSAEEVLGRNPNILKSGETSREVYDAIWSALADGRPWHGILQNRKKSGELYWEYSSISPIRLNNGSTVKYLKTAEDITDLRKQEEEAFRLKQQDAIAIMAAGMAHDFNNLLQVIIGSVMLAKLHCQPDSKAHELLSTAEKSTQQASELSRRLKQLISKGEEQHLSASLSLLVLTTVKATLKGSGIKLIEKVPHDIASVKFNISQMQLVITQVTTNPIEAMPHGGTLEVSAENCSLAEKNNLQLRPGHYVHFVFADSGIGITPENLSRIFNPYFTTKSLGARKGTGLSLASCHSIIRHHNGAITAESVSGRGSSIHIFLPAAASEDIQPA